MVSRLLPLAGLLAPALFIAAACSDSKDSSSSTPAPNQAVSTPTPATTANTPAVVGGASTTATAARASATASAASSPATSTGKVSANNATQAQVQAALQAAGVPQAASWAREVVEYRPYPADDPTIAKLRQNLVKYNPGPGIVDQIVAVLSLP